jgi:hypothetical protein
MIYPHSTRINKKVVSEFKAKSYMNESYVTINLVANEKILHDI